MGDLPASCPVLESPSKAGGRVPEDSLPSALHSFLYKETKQTMRLASPGLTPAACGRGSCVLWMPPGGCCGGRGLIVTRI